MAGIHAFFVFRFIITVVVPCLSSEIVRHEFFHVLFIVHSRQSAHSVRIAFFSPISPLSFFVTKVRGNLTDPAPLSPPTHRQLLLLPTTSIVNMLYSNYCATGGKRSIDGRARGMSHGSGWTVVSSRRRESFLQSNDVPYWGAG